MENNQFNNSPYPVPLMATSNSSHRMKVSDLGASGPRTGRSQLPADFKPSVFSVICGRGKESYDYVGNHHFRELASMYVARYARANSKGDKSEIVSEMVGMVHQADGTFCKFEEGAWFKVGDHYAREKAGALLRDMVQAQQRSPVKAKLAKKLKKTKKPAPARPTIQKQYNTQKSQQQLVDDSAGHSDLIFTPTQQCSEQMVEDSIAVAGRGHSDDSTMSTWSSCWGEELLGFDEDDLCIDTSFGMDSLKDEDDYCNIFDMASLLQVTGPMPVTGDAGEAECLFNPAA
jgi:hypothetical protein